MTTRPHEPTQASLQLQSLAGLEALVREVIALVEAHMPAVDTARAKRRLGWRQQAWA